MPTNSLLPSVIGNSVAARDRVSAVRQRLGLEMGAAQLRQLHPSPEAPADKPGAAIKAASAGAPARPPAPPERKPAPSVSSKPKTEADIDYENYPIPDDKMIRMLGQIQDFIDTNNNGIDDRVEAAHNPKDGHTAVPKDSAGRQKLVDPVINKALAPFKEFYTQNGRMPTIEDLRSMAKGTTNA